MILVLQKSGFGLGLLSGEIAVDPFPSKTERAVLAPDLCCPANAAGQRMPHSSPGIEARVDALTALRTLGAICQSSARQRLVQSPEKAADGSVRR